MTHPETWLRPLKAGLFCEPGGFFIDPMRVVERAVITHAHADHARPGHQAVLASAPTIALMQARMGKAGLSHQALRWGERVRLGEVTLWLQPAGHVLGSAQVVMEYRGQRVVVSGDYKRQPDRSCEPFEPVACDVFVTEATFGLPIFRMPDPAAEIGKLLASVALFPERAHVVGCYSLGKTQRVITLLRDAGWQAPIHLHGALVGMCAVYERFGVELGPLLPVSGTMAGAIVLAPPTGTDAKWSRRLADPVACLASGWMLSAKRARQSGAELPLAISDHADWDDLLGTIAETGAGEVWVTHGSEAALIHELGRRGIRGRALRLIGYGEEA